MVLQVVNSLLMKVVVEYYLVQCQLVNQATCLPTIKVKRYKYLL